MGILNKVFGTSESQEVKPKIDWNNLTDLKDLDDVSQKSFETPVFIFKHSTTCSVSRMAIKQFENEYNLNENQVVPYYLDLLKHRDISNEIASKFEVIHQSPQLILIKNGKAVYSKTHSEIDFNELKNNTLQ